MLKEITLEAKHAVEELLQVAKLQEGDLFVVGCSTSEVGGHKIGSNSNWELAESLFAGIYPVLETAGIYIAAQCCEHLNRAIVLEGAAAKAYGYTPVNVVPQPKAGGSFATKTYQILERPVVVEGIAAHAGIDIGGTLIGMHLAPVAVPVRLSRKGIGEAGIICARSRPKFIGGIRAAYDESKL